MPKLFWQILSYYLIAVNVLAFVLMGIDKRRAKKNAWRIPEKTLFLPAIFGGALGGVAGMRLFRHKTRHWYFTAINTAALLAWAALLAYRNGVFS